MAGQRYICVSCGFIYDPAEGDPDGGVPPGTEFADIPDDWFCPVCGARKRDFEDWQVDGEMMRAARPDALFMHCLPAHRGEEVADEVIESPDSVVFDQAENRLHAQKALLVEMLV